MKKSITLSIQNHPMGNLQQVHPVKEQSSYVTLQEHIGLARVNLAIEKVGKIRT